MSAVQAPLSRLVELIGLPAALRLVGKFGGVPIYIPQPSRVLAHGKVAQVIGLEAMRALAAAWPKEHIKIPRGAEYLRRQRAISIHRDRDRLSLRDLALKYEMTDRNVLYVLARPAPGEMSAAVADSAQGSLF